MRKRFSINRVCVVADRGMISAETIAELEARKLLYILGVRERSDKLVRELVLDDPAPFVPFFLTKRKKEIDYEAKAVTLAGRRYIVCRNHDQMRKDAAARAAILAALERQLKKGDKALVGNKGYRRFLMKPDDSHFAIDRPRRRRGRQVRRRLRAPDQCPAVAARSDASLQAKQGDFQESRVGGLGFEFIDRPFVWATLGDGPRRSASISPAPIKTCRTIGPLKVSRRLGGRQPSWLRIAAIATQLSDRERGWRRRGSSAGGTTAPA